MSAQYRPYRDEESVDGLEAATWSDHEPGSIQIYEKTTEELPFSSNHKKISWIHVVLFTAIGILGFILGFFVHQKDSNILNDPNILEHYETSYAFEDPTIKDKLLEAIKGTNILSVLMKYNDTNRTPGSDDDHSFATYIQDSFNSFGLDSTTASNFTFKTMMPTQPTVVKLLNKDNKTIFSNIDIEHYPHPDMRPYLPLSQAEETTIISNKIVYVNRGLKEDFSKLATLGINNVDLEGKVLVVRQSYYQAHEVVITAEELNAKALLLFPDPDIFGTSSPFPKQLQLPNDAARSQPTAWSNYGDLASFNLSSSGIDASKLGLDKDIKVTIPVIPISYNTAHRLLRGLSGAQAPNEWNCFDYTLYVGPTYREENNQDKRDKIMIEFHNRETTITSTTITGTISGSLEADRYVIIGSRRDSLNRGVLDSISGTSVMLEIARAFGSIVKEFNWRPKRTIVFASFGSESLNLMGSSHWLEDHQRLLHSRAVAYINCDLIVTGNKSAVIAASPLLFQVLYNSSEQVTNPNFDEDPTLPSVYDVWKKNHPFNKSESGKILDDELDKIFVDHELTDWKLKKPSGKDDNNEDDSLGTYGNFLVEYRKSATIKTRPSVRRLDLRSIYSPFFLYAGIPSVDVRYAGFSDPQSSARELWHGQKISLIEDTLPVIGTKYDNLEAIRLIDPHLKYHVAIAQTLSEITRDLADSTFLPFNLLEYAVVLKDSFNNFEAKYGNTFNKSDVDLEPLKLIVLDFMRAAVLFHHRQDSVNPRNMLTVRKINDQLMLMERIFLDSNSLTSHSDRKHIILSPHDGQERHEGFPLLVDWITLLEGEDPDPGEQSLFINILKVHYKIVIYTIANAIKIIDEVHLL